MSSEPQLKYCSNCKKDDIPADNFVMHEVYCRRNIVLCERCGEPVQLSQLQEHQLSEHASEACPKCKQTVERCFLEQHQADECPRREKHCDYCDISFPASSYSEHVEQCGSRTESCERCKKRICLRDMAAHTGSRQCLSEQSNRTGHDKVCDFCGSSVSVTEYSQHAATCGDTKVYCDTCRQQVLLRNMAEHVGSGCESLVVGAKPRTWNRDDSFPLRAFSGVEIPHDDTVHAFDMLSDKIRIMSPFARSDPLSKRTVPSQFERDLSSPAYGNRAGRNEISTRYMDNYLEHGSTSARASLDPAKVARQGPAVGQLGSEPLRRVPMHVECTHHPAAAAAHANSEWQPVSPDGARTPSAVIVSSLPIREIPVKRAPIVLPPPSLVRTGAPNTMFRLNSEPHSHRAEASNRSLARPEWTPGSGSSQPRMQRETFTVDPAATSEHCRPRDGESDATGSRLAEHEVSSVTTLPPSSPSSTAGNENSGAQCNRCHEVFPLDALPDHQAFCGVYDEHGEHVLASAFKRGNDAFLSQPRFQSYQGLAGIDEAGDGASTFDDYGAGSAGATAMHRPPETADTQYAPDVALIPCQQCGQPVPADRLDDHEAACGDSGDAILFERLVRDRQAAADSISGDRADQALYSAGVLNTPDRSRASPEVEIPCQFCCELISAKELNFHQALCPSRRSGDPMPGIYQYSRQQSYDVPTGVLDSSVQSTRTAPGFYALAPFNTDFDVLANRSRRTNVCKVCGELISASRRMAVEGTCQWCAAGQFTNLSSPDYPIGPGNHRRALPTNSVSVDVPRDRSSSNMVHGSGRLSGLQGNVSSGEIVCCRYCNQNFLIEVDHEASCPYR